MPFAHKVTRRAGTPSGLFSGCRYAEVPRRTTTLRRARPDARTRPAGAGPTRARPGRRLAVALALATGLAIGCATGAHAGAIGDQVFAIEAGHGDDSAQVIARLVPLEAGARAAGGDDLRIFLAAWGYAHGAIDKPSVAEAAIEELTELGAHDDAALASAWTLRACMLQFSGRMREAQGWIEAAMPVAARRPSPDLSYWVDMVGADVSTTNGRFDEGLRLYEAAAEAARASRNPRREAQAWLGMVPLRLVAGQTADATRAAAQVRELAARADDRVLVVSGWILESFAAEADGDAARAARARRAALAVQREIPQSEAARADAMNPQATSDGLASELEGLLSLSELHTLAGHFDRARDYALRAQREATTQHNEADRAQALIDLGVADLGAGRADAARREIDEGLAARGRLARDAELLIQLNRVAAAFRRAGDSDAALARLSEALLLQEELTRHDRESAMIALQRQSSFQAHQRQLERLEHENALQSMQIERHDKERLLTWLLAVAMGLGGLATGRLYLRARQSNRQLALNNEALEFASLHDEVTGLANRRAMEAHTAALSASPWCSVSISVKGFGLVVGSVGHQLGDALLRQIAARLDVVARGLGGRLFRIDGVTFGAVFALPRGDRRVAEALTALAEATQAPFEMGNQDFMVALGVGAAHYPEDAATAQEAARLAELARMVAHAEPGNTCAVYDARIGDSHRDKLRMEGRLLKALEHGAFELHYQGQRDVRAGRVTGFEALLRWHDEGRMISPAQFIPIAEETGLIVRIGAWVLAQACRQARAWADAGLGRPVVAVNISPRQFNHPDFLATVRETLHATGVDPSQIELEITEGSVMDDAEASIAQLHALRALGLHLAIDDFGTGYASLSYLRRFPLDRLKIDRSFITQLTASDQDDTIVRTVIELAHSLGLSVTAEGVETRAQEEILAHWGCDVVQGFLHARPAPATAAVALLAAAHEPATQEPATLVR
jgi:EAL domain-containing protein (putative c-di-GMP-specific phosphodiesterase class I)/GGDEF domain-containing protein